MSFLGWRVKNRGKSLPTFPLFGLVHGSDIRQSGASDSLSPGGHDIGVQWPRSVSKKLTAAQRCGDCLSWKPAWAVLTVSALALLGLFSLS